MIASSFVQIVWIKWKNIVNPLLHYSWPSLIRDKIVKISQVIIWVQNARRLVLGLPSD